MLNCWIKRWQSTAKVKSLNYDEYIAWFWYLGGESFAHVEIFEKMNLSKIHLLIRTFIDLRKQEQQSMNRAKHQHNR